MQEVKLIDRWGPYRKGRVLWVDPQRYRSLLRDGLIGDPDAPQEDSSREEPRNTLFRVAAFARNVESGLGEGDSGAEGEEGA